ncbi:MAG: hypothetical protein KAT17_10120 [Candidatus Aminicenantes bacterium]|nr:hypothetical protein [Candidatus Aminicenantes bacterium]
MAGKLITNQDRFLSEVINNILPAPKNLYFLVGYFYFSGFEKLYRNLGDKKLKILVGMDIEKIIQNKVKEYEKEIDQMVYESYDLTPEKNEIVEEAVKE